ncbi:MAG TPA: exopolysaccharide biosynthesis protein [Acidimicrobiales bacterium]|nr:exopolysaccharide biosynthesis protein [Acidimicrobiales bacterium]
MDDPEELGKLSDQLEDWMTSDRHKTVGDLVETFGPSSFAVLFVVLMAFPALPIPTGGVSHVLEAVAMLLALELVIGRREVWIPERWANRELKGLSSTKFQQALLRRIRWLERFSRPRFSRLLELRLARAGIGLVVFGLCLTAFLAPPFSGLDTFPSLGVVVLSLGVLLRDLVIAAIGTVIGAVGVLLVVFLGRAILDLF